ncbi:cellulose-binding protein [Gilvimarinus agarilyticus]|uniref:glycine cleavage system protein R n=1 Tax=unclassified Gilvimarinus TaxID=2642066 RepID=UPI001C0A371E|nr:MULTISPECIES: ACT domain-containing protein [unclassified Gilvimarinus]MBU2886800.1 cellulose-binding protein [Gilvimarinus agarilyticus]MDO6571464.1 ACT domain-containing protein [Gilvimarinus sp. 2_MG-2023]MDO6747355.1 ACT domain-containing protein [Gilvimarinus sp. 1_MG-2023]
MNQILVLTVISADRPGVVQQLAKTIHDNQGNWLESRMSHLAGQFAGILQVAVPEEHCESLLTALTALSGQGLRVVAEKASSPGEDKPKALAFSVVGPDRSGIVYEVSQAFASRGISVDELETDTSSMPWSGEPMFEATGVIHLPKGVNMDELYDQLDAIADELAVDIRLEDLPESESAE